MKTLMEDSGLKRHNTLMNFGKTIVRLSKPFTLASTVYCAVHWLIAHEISVHVFFRAVLVGGIMTLVLASLSTWWRIRQSPPMGKC